jgi:ABC-type uncharacterized transport system substrate-binding protein
VVAFINPGSRDDLADLVRAFRKGLSESGYVEGRNVMVEYHWLEYQFDRLPALTADLVSRRVAVIVTSSNINATIAARAATATIPIVFAVIMTRSSMVLSPASPGRAATRPAADGPIADYRLTCEQRKLVERLASWTSNASGIFKPAHLKRVP